MKNLSVRTISAAAYASLMIGSLLTCRYFFAIVFLFISCATLLEFYSITIGKGSHRLARALMLLAAVTLFVTEFLTCGWDIDRKWTALAILPFLASLTSSMMEADKATFRDVAYIITGFAYIAVPCALSNRIVLTDGGFDGTLLLAFFILVWASDVGGYVFGMSFGQKPTSRKLCPHISPKKSWAGLWGGLVTTPAAAIGLRSAGMFDIPFIHCIILGIIICVGGLFGDLFESMWKRSYDLKDSGNIIPGHGGMLDRFDSSLFAMPLAALYLSLFNLI